MLPPAVRPLRHLQPVFRVNHGDTGLTISEQPSLPYSAILRYNRRRLPARIPSRMTIRPGDLSADHDHRPGRPLVERTPPTPPSPPRPPTTGAGSSPAGPGPVSEKTTLVTAGRTAPEAPHPNQHLRSRWARVHRYVRRDHSSRYRAGRRWLQRRWRETAQTPPAGLPKRNGKSHSTCSKQ